MLRILGKTSGRVNKDRIAKIIRILGCQSNNKGSGRSGQAWANIAYGPGFFSRAERSEKIIWQHIVIAHKAFSLHNVDTPEVVPHFNLIHEGSLPRSPFFIAALIAAKEYFHKNLN